MAIDLESYTSPEVQLIKEAHRAVLAGDLSPVTKLFHKDYHHVIHPRSLGKPPINKDGWLGMVAECLSSVSTPLHLEPTYHSIVEAPGKLVLHMSAHVKGLFGEDRTDESIWIVGFAPGEDGSLKIKDVEQFADTTNFIDMASLTAKASK